ncbi:hypothetical protein LUZ60_005037 [Juncus effusus]|nr:hypothetical protein LUZ60_005037 [Juncus effusus]
MASSKSTLIFSLFLFSLLTVTLATFSQVNVQEILKAHNDERATLKLPPLVWSKQLELYAKAYAAKRAVDCALIHSMGEYGENLFQCSPAGTYTFADAVQYWIDEKQYYDYESNSCADGQMCGHYTQVVWANTKQVGCAHVTCLNGEDFMTCNYDPPGNYIGEKPY